MVAQIALVLWILVSIGMFAVLHPLRAFLLTFVIGYLVLPVEVGDGITFTGTIYISQSLRIDKLTACNIGAIIGTCLFASQVLTRYRFHWVDAVYGAVLGGAFLTSLANGLGAKDGVSHAVETLRQIFPLIVLSRLYITGPAELYEAVHAVIAGAFLYSFLCVAEFRLSPQAHRMVYGYFQHGFEQFERYNHFRPAGFLRHAIELAFFMGTSTALAAWLWFKGLLRPLWGTVPPWAVVTALAVGTATTLTFSGYAACLASAGVLAMLAITRSRWMLAVLPALAVAWMVGRYTNTVDGTFLMNSVDKVDVLRMESLQYRLEAERLHLEVAAEHLWLGKGAMFGVLRKEDGSAVKAVDSWWMITLVFYGVVGLGGWLLVWGAGIVDTMRYWGWLTEDAKALTAGVSVIAGAQFIDFLFNAFPSPFLMMLGMGLVAALQRYPKSVAVMQPLFEDVEEGLLRPDIEGAVS